MVVFLNYQWRGSFDDVFPTAGIDTTMEELEDVFAFYDVKMPTRFPLRNRLHSSETRTMAEGAGCAVAVTAMCMWIHYYVCCAHRPE